MAPFLILLVTGASAACLLSVWLLYLEKSRCFLTNIHTSSWLMSFHLNANVSDVLHNALSFGVHLKCNCRFRFKCCSLIWIKL